MAKKIQALKVKQWLNTWDNVTFDAKNNRPKPQPHFYLFSIAAKDLKRLSGVFSRQATDRRSSADELGIQRRHNPERSRTISSFIENGFPWSDLTDRKRDSGEFDNLKKPGWLPTAIVINILSRQDTRRDKQVDPNDLIQVEESEGDGTRIVLPESFDEPDNWSPQQVPPIEIIDGQHRLWAFDDIEPEGDFELPVVAFHGLGLSWQAYLFYTINISPKKINRSLAYDLYPLLRAEDWLEKFEGHVVYRESRAQELVDMLYRHPRSPWHSHIDMLGGEGKKMVSQAAWIRTLLASFIKSSEGRGVRIGGLFGAPVGGDETMLPWSRIEQGAFLIFLGEKLKSAIATDTGLEWAEKLRKEEMDPQVSIFETPEEDIRKDAAFYGKSSLLNQDQGIRALFQIFNDMFFIASQQEIDLEHWEGVDELEGEDEQIGLVVDSFGRNESISSFADMLCASLAQYDWRSSSAEGLTDEQEREKSGFRGSGGYQQLRKSVLKFLSNSQNRQIAKISGNILHWID
jgi:DGQHR domain-containing protein